MKQNENDQNHKKESTPVVDNKPNGKCQLNIAVATPKGIFTSFAVEDEPRVDAWLQQRGVRHTIGDLYHDSSLCPECGPELVEVFKTPLSFSVRAAIASALFARKLNASQKRQ